MTMKTVRAELATFRKQHPDTHPDEATLLDWAKMLTTGRWASMSVLDRSFELSRCIMYDDGPDDL